MAATAGKRLIGASNLALLFYTQSVFVQHINTFVDSFCYTSYAN